jgi:hypothetical protein
MELDYSLPLHFSTLYLDKKSKFVFFVDGGMHPPQVLKSSQIIWKFSNYYEILK